MPRLLLSCGEPSGDLYAAELVRHLRRSTPDLEVFGLGGDRLAAQGAHLIGHVRDLAVVGIFEVLSHLRHLRRVFKHLLAEADRARPALAVLVDYPDFNLRLAARLQRRGIPVVYYVSPQVWAWRKGRIGTIRDTAARMLVIFPFEEEIYRRAGVPVTFVGHPLVDLIPSAPDPRRLREDLGLDPERPMVAILPGSRPKEVAHNLPPLAGALDLLTAQRPELDFVLAVAPSIDPRFLEQRLEGRRVRLIEGRTHTVLGACSLALVASGTATVEAALLGAPMVVVYRLSRLTYLLGRPFVHVPHFAMVNLIAGRQVVPEVIQGDFTPDRVASEAIALLDPEGPVRQMRADLEEVRRRLGAPGASERAALEVAPFIRAK